VRRARTKAGDAFVLWTTVKITAVLIAEFILLGIVVPDLVDAHDTVLLIVAIAAGFAALGIAAVTAISIRRSYRRLRRATIHLIER
jgi:hypothetical protein